MAVLAKATRLNFLILDPENPSNDDLAFLHSDHLASTRLLTDTGGGIYGDSYDTSAMDFSPYGELIGGTSSLTSYRFTGQYFDSLLSLQYHRARWLNPSTANWLSTDPLFDFPDNFDNPYAYAGLNPLNNWDLSGTISFAETMVVMTIVSILVSMDIFVGIKILYSQGKEGAHWAGVILQILKNVGVMALCVFVPVIAMLMAIKDLPKIIETIVTGAKLIGEHIGSGDYLMAAFALIREGR